MRIKLKKVTVASLNVSLFRLLSSCHSFRDLQQCRNNFTKPRLVLLKFSEDLHECFVLLVAFAIVQLVAFAKGR